MTLSEYSLEKKSDLTALADSIRAKVESANNMTLAQMKEALDGMEAGASLPSGRVDISNTMWLSSPASICFINARGNLEWVDIGNGIGSSDDTPSEVTIEPLINSVFIIDYYDGDSASYGGLLPTNYYGDVLQLKQAAGLDAWKMSYSEEYGAWGSITFYAY